MTQFRPDRRISQKGDILLSTSVHNPPSPHIQKRKAPIAAACLHRPGLWVVPQAGFAAVSASTAASTAVVAGRGGIFRRLPLVVLLEAGHDAEVRLALRAVVLGFPPQDSPVRIDGVPAEVTAQRGALPYHRTMAGPLTVQAGNFGRSAAC